MKKRALNIALNCCLIIAVLFLFATLISSSFNKINPVVEAADVDTNLYVKVDSNVTIYVSGDFVTNKNSKSYETFANYSFSYYEYNVSQSSTVRLDAVNENKIFKQWLILNVTNSNAVADVTSTYLVNDNNSKSSVTFTYPSTTGIKLAIIPQYYEQTTSAHKGMHFLDPFIIEEANDFNALSNIVNGKGTTEDYAVFDLIPSDANRLKLATGYFRVIKGLTLSEDFESIGSLDYPFRGLLDGNNNGEIAIISLNQVREISGTGSGKVHYNGLFGAIAENTADNKPVLVRNVVMQGAISYQEKNQTEYNNAYIGGVAGISGNNVIIDNITTKVDISASSYDTNIYAGGIFGYSYTSLEKYRDIYLVSDHKNWNISTNSATSGGNIYVGTYAGYLANARVIEYDISSSTFNLTAAALGVSGDVYLGLVAGYYDQITSTIDSDITLGSSANKSLQHIDLIFDKNCSINAQTSNGNSYAGTFFGYINASSSTLPISNIYFESDLSSTASEIISATKDQNSSGNVYVGGIIGYVNGFNLVYDETLSEYNKPLFDANLNIIANQKGKASTTSGFSVAGGIVGRGYINVNDSTIFLNSENSKIQLKAIQDKFTVHDTVQSFMDTNDNYSTIEISSGSVLEHLSVGMFAGSFGTSSLSNYAISNFTLIANNYDVEAERQEGSLNFGQITVGGLVGFSTDLDLTNCRLLFNKCNIKLNSLSYEIKYKAEGNNAYLGGVIGRYYGRSDRMAVMNNVTIAGYDFDAIEPYVFSDTNISESSVNILGVQNTKAGGSDYQGQIYVGGFVGCTSFFQIKKCNFFGSDQTENKISLRGNNDIDSAMVGGIVGIARSKYGGSKYYDLSSYTGIFTHTEISECIVENVHVIAESSCDSQVISGVQDADMYAGGIIGAVFFDHPWTNSVHRGEDVSCDIIRNVVTNCTIETIGHNYMKGYTGGLIGGSTWNSSCTSYLINNIVYNNRISAISETNGKSKSAGVLAYNQNVANCYINGCAVVNNTIYSYNNDNKVEKAKSSGILCRSASYDTNRIINNYVSSEVIAEIAEHGTGLQYVICGDSYSSFSSNYYNSSIVSLNSSSTTKNSAVAVAFNDILDISTENGGSTGTLYGNKQFPTTKVSINDTIGGYIGNKNAIIPYTSVQLSNGNVIFDVFANGVYSYKTKGQTGASNALLWINIFGNNVDYENLSIKEAVRNGYIIFGSQKLVTSGTSSYAIDFDYPDQNSDVTIISDSTIDYNDFNKYGVYDSLDTVAMKFQSTLKPLTIRVNVLTTTTTPYSLTNTADIKISTSVDSGNISEMGIFNCTYNGDGTADITFIPNNEYLDKDIRTLTIKVSAGGTSKDLIFKIKSNYYTAMQGRYSDTTVPLNYEDEVNTSVGSLELGQEESKPYVYFDHTTIKIIPALTRANEGDIFSDDNCPLVTYTAQVKYPNTSYANTTINPSGDLVVGDVAPGTIYKITITLSSKYNKTGSEITSDVFVSILDNVVISTSLKGCDYEGPFNAGKYSSTIGENYNSNYVFYITPKSGFGDVPTTFNINIAGTDYDLLNDVDVASGKYTVDSPLKNIEIYDLGKSDQITSTTTVGTQTTTTIKWTKENEGFKVIIPAEAIVGNIEITIEYSVVYTLLFDVNLDFDSISESEKYLSFTATSAYNISDLIGFTRKYDATEGLYYYDLNEMIDSVDEEGNPIKIFKNKLKKLEELAPFGYSLHGWYLIEDASYVSSYGKSIEEILAGYSNDPNTLDQEMKLNANYTFYARWSFSIFLNEAPGTKIECSFPPHFLIQDAWNVDVPINNKKGFSFTIIKDEEFSGEAALLAHILIKHPDRQDDYILTEVTAEKYHEDMYVYTVKPEDITGALVITTFSTANDFIVGEKEDAVDIEIVPEDGVFTLRYIANHLEDSERKLQTFAYAEDNFGLLKKLKVEFTKNSIPGSDLYDEEYILPAGTEVKLYYSKNKGETIVGYYKLPTNMSSFYATDFTILNTNTKMFNDSETFKSFFNYSKVGDAETYDKNASEKYYFVITPPNGYSTLNGNEIAECKTSIGYVKNGGEYLSCKRYTYDSEDANKPNYFDEMNEADSTILDDIACADDYFIVYKSRETMIESISNSTSIKFIDNLTTINVGGNTYTNTGDWRHQDKYFVLGVQVYTDAVDKTPINLDGLTITLFYNGHQIDSQTVGSKSPKNAVYFETKGTGEYTFEVSITTGEEGSAELASGFDSNTVYGFFVTLLESTSVVKPSMGVVRSDVIEVSSSDIAIGKLFKGLSLDTVSIPYTGSITLPDTNTTNDKKVTWKYNGNVISGTVSASVLTPPGQSPDEVVTVTLIASIEGYEKAYSLSLTPNYDALRDSYISNLSLLDHFENTADIDYSTGYINDGSILVDSIELSNDKYDLLVEYKESMGNQAYILQDTSFYSLRGRAARISRPYKIYGWLDEGEVTITAQYTLVDKEGNILSTESEEIIYDTYNGHKLRVNVNNEAITTVLTMIHSLQTSYMNSDLTQIITINSVTYTVPTVVVAFEESDITYNISNVNWDTTKDNLVYSNTDISNHTRTYSIQTKVVNLNGTINKDIEIAATNASNFLINEEIYDGWNLNLVGSITKTGTNWEWRNQNSQYRTSSKNDQMTLTYSIENINSLSIVSSDNTLDRCTVAYSSNRIIITSNSNNVSNTNRATFTYSKFSISIAYSELKDTYITRGVIN